MSIPQSIADAIHLGQPVLTDGAIETEVMFTTDLVMDPDVGSASLLDDEASRETLEALYSGYLDAAAVRGLPAVVGTPTFRASTNPMTAAGRGGDKAVRAMNTEAVALHRAIRERCTHGPVWIAGVIGPAGDAYTPGIALSPEAGREYHQVQASALAEAGADFLFAATFPAVGEAIGVCLAMQPTGAPFVVSYVLDAGGRVLDGTPLAEAVDKVDQKAAPLYHSISCVHPSVARKALESVNETASAGRIKEVKANAAKLSPPNSSPSPRRSVMRRTRSPIRWPGYIGTSPYRWSADAAAPTRVTSRPWPRGSADAGLHPLARASRTAHPAR